MTDKILSILNSVHLPTCRDFEIISNRTFIGNGYDRIGQAEWLIKLQSRFEELTRGKWVECRVCDGRKKGFFGESFEQTCDSCEGSGKYFQPALLKNDMFVCEVEKPIDYDRFLTGKAKMQDAINDEVMLLWLKKCNDYQAAQSKVWFESKVDVYATFLNRVNNATVFDLIIELDRYNRTAKEKIEIKWTSHFVEKLLQ